METCNTLRVFMNSLRSLTWQRLILIKIKANLMYFWKSYIAQKEIKKPSGKSIRVWEKTQLRFETFEKILKFTFNNLNGKLIFCPFSLSSSRTFVILYPSGTYQIFLGWLGGLVVSPGLRGTFEYGGQWVGVCINPWLKPLKITIENLNFTIRFIQFVNILLQNFL